MYRKVQPYHPDGCIVIGHGSTHSLAVLSSEKPPSIQGLSRYSGNLSKEQLYSMELQWNCSSIDEGLSAGLRCQMPT